MIPDIPQGEFQPNPELDLATKPSSKSPEPTRNPLAVVVLISGSGSNLQALIDGQQGGDLPIVIRAVISNVPDVRGLERAEAAGISTAVLNHRLFDDRAAFDTALMALIDSFDPALVVLAGFMRILTPDFVRHYLGRLLNIHPSLLPKYQGLHTHARALAAGDSEHGATVHFVTEELDGGPPILQARVPVLPDDDDDRLAARVLKQEHKIYPEAVRWFASGRLCLDPDKRARLDGKLLTAPVSLPPNC
ncbi:phosphoribosylglycinamide formyltransferase [Thiorhodovibrio frisius]|uniref:Phosphoribosylglycinamide formyltransferase n=1 Tax=Thiorhodovibrio frisius TaxID=631362 RepID=H8Z4Z9_9GAMM|nr:phosphoribosylglycinamide formyltransferase [Thiorhodovibrio frisius]EIC20406.1 phosphoribosylglycinamide formyltransferase, formyltetrahydrofolate-dependent [Thiorhodovibrio frisius]WPL21147.1 Phosphoribosylglycinamide formyltransferase [Thiorhodovibrio frisius]